MSLTPITDDSGAVALQLEAASTPSAGRLLRDPKLWRKFGHAADISAITGGVLTVLLLTGSHASDLVLAVAFSISSLLLLYSRRSLGRRLAVGLLDSCARAVASCAIGGMVAIAAGAFAGLPSPDMTALRLWVLSAGLVCLVRTALGLFERRARGRGLLLTPTLIVGAGVVGGWVVRRLEQQQAALGLRPIGFLDVDPSAGSADDEIHLPVLGTPADTIEVARQTGAQQVVFAFSWERDHHLADVVRSCQAAGLDVAIVPRLYEAINERASLDHVGGLPLIGFKPLNSQGWRFAVKYAIDQVFAAVALIMLSPLMLGIVVAVRISSPGRVIFRQRRVGRHGREFDLLKFRSMREAGSSSFTPRGGIAPGGVEGDDRRTRVGRWLRNTSLDELPQLLNVLRGEMSLVGPRPERPEFAAAFAEEIPGYAERHRVRPGITGWAQVNGLRGQTSIADRVEWDNHYIENWSIRMELRTLALTIAAVLLFREQGETASPAEEPLRLLHGGPPDSGDSPAPAPAPEGAPAPKSDPPGPSPLRPTRPAPDPVATKPAPDPVATSTSVLATKPALRLVQTPTPEASETHWFCGYCGTAAPDPTPPPLSRVCEHCSAGLLLEAPADVAPGCGEAFLVVDARLTVQAVSRHAEKVLGVCETDVTNEPITELLTDADVELDHPESFANALAGAAMDDEGRHSTFVRPRGDFGIRMRARISHCGPPRAALIVLETPRPDSGPRLRLVQANAPRAKQAKL